MVKALNRRTLPKDLLVVGPAGTGKTFGLLRFFHVLARGNRNLRILFCRATRSALSESVLVTYEQEILPLDGMQHMAYGIQRRVRQVYRYPSGSEIVLGSLDNPTKVLSTAWDFAFINEAIEATEDAWESLRSRMNRPGRHNRFGYLIGDTNPGDPSHWLLRRINEGSTTLWDTRHEANPAMFDGRNWTASGRAYLAQLDGLTGTRRARLRDGLWAAGEGLWFTDFDPAIHVQEDAEYDPTVPTYLALDSGVETAAVWFQVHRGKVPRVVVFGEYYRYNKPPSVHAEAVLSLSQTLCGGLPDYRLTDPAGGKKEAASSPVIDLYRQAGLSLRPWRSGPNSVAPGLARIEDLLMVRDGKPCLTVHPRCRMLISAFANYKRKKRGNQWVDQPADPQHPHEDMMDSLRSGLYDVFGAPVLKITTL